MSKNNIVDRVEEAVSELHSLPKPEIIRRIISGLSSFLDSHIYITGDPEIEYGAVFICNDWHLVDSIQLENTHSVLNKDEILSHRESIKEAIHIAENGTTAQKIEKIFQVLMEVLDAPVATHYAEEFTHGYGIIFKDEDLIPILSAEEPKDFYDA